MKNTNDMKTNKERGAVFPLSQRTNLIIQLVAFVIIVLIVVCLKHSSLGYFPVRRLFCCSVFMIWVTVIQCAICSFKGGKFILLWIVFFILSSCLQINSSFNFKCLVTVDKIIPYSGGKQTAYERIYVNVCGCTDKEIIVQCPKFFKDMTNLKKGDTLLSTISIYPNRLLPGGISNITIDLIKDYTSKEKKEYTPPSYWYYSFFPSCLNDYGCNVVYKATYRDNNLHFVDIYKKSQTVNYYLNTSNYTNEMPDTFLVYKNINEKVDNNYKVCIPEINIPENWAKISDYGYIFDYDIYSQEEVEKECPGIKEYVEQYKKRMATKAD